MTEPKKNNIAKSLKILKGFQLDAESNEEAENWIHVFSTETRSKFSIQNVRETPSDSKATKIIEYKCVVPTCDLGILLSFLNPDQNEGVKYRVDFKNAHRFAKCNQVLRPFDPKLKDYTKFVQYSIPNCDIITHKYSIKQPSVYDVKTSDKDDILQWLRQFQAHKQISLSIHPNEDDTKAIVSSCTEQECPFKIRMKLLTECFRVVEIGKHNHGIRLSSTVIVPGPSSRPESSTTQEKVALSGLPIKKDRKSAHQPIPIPEEFGARPPEVENGFPQEVEDTVVEIEPPEEPEARPLPEYHSEMEMLCDRTNSDYFVIDSLRMYLFTTHMMRQAAAHSCSRCMVYIGTTKNEIVYGFYLTVISSKLPTGVYPILMAFHTEESVDQYIMLLNAILEKYPLYFGGAKYPDYVMMDGNFSGFGAVEAVFKNSKIFICPRLTLTTLKSIASNIPDTKLRSMYNELTQKIINSPDRVEADRALYSLLNGSTRDLPQVREFMDIIDGYPGQVRICDRVGLGIGDRHTNNITLVMMNMITSSILEGQNFFTVDGAIYWIIKELDLRLFAKFVQNVQMFGKKINKIYMQEFKAIKGHTTLSGGNRPSYRLELENDEHLDVLPDSDGCPCLTALKAEMCGHLYYLVKNNFYKPTAYQPLVCKEQLAEEEVLFLKNRFNPGEIEFKNKMDPIEVKPDWRPELRPSVSFSATLHDNKCNIVREMIDVLNRLPMEELRTRLLGSAKVVQMLSNHNKEENVAEKSPHGHTNGNSRNVEYDGERTFIDGYDDEFDDDDDADYYRNQSTKRRGRPSKTTESARKKAKNDNVRDFDGLPNPRTSGRAGPSTSRNQVPLDEDMHDISSVLGNTRMSIANRGHRFYSNAGYPDEEENIDEEVSRAAEFLSSETRMRERPKIQPIPAQQRRIIHQTQLMNQSDQDRQGKPFLDLDDEATLRSTINELHE
ncbi:hypothetical protein Ciccas_002226 [Cichlidogyrus casuarinus]|uniref:PH domain-containing protein n=1 Tax=Cichlidogyrus casuarinus TaxID=1844966 RepID=A0ABD2QL13_9PLAT